MKCTSYAYAARSAIERHDREAALYGHRRVVVDRGRREQDEHDDGREQHRLAAHEEQRPRDDARDRRVRV